MLHEQNEKVIELLAPATVATSATASASVDRLGFSSARLVVRLPAATATNSSAKWGVLKLQEADVTAVSSATDITAFVGTTNTTSATGFVIPAQNDTTNPQLVELLVDCRARKRYLFLIYQAAASHSTSYGVATLGRAAITPSIDSQRGTNLTTVIG